MTKIAIIGAGISGLSVAHLLQHTTAKVVIFEKSRGVGGRVSTRRSEQDYIFDHGAQYFTARTKPFQHFIKPLIKHKVIKRWNARHIKYYNNKIAERSNWTDCAPHYVGVPNMNSIAKHLAKNLNIYINTKIIALDYGKKWNLQDELGQTYRNFDWVIYTVPSPQVKQILPTKFKYYSDVNRIKMDACFSLMLGFKTNLLLDFETADIANHNLKWISVNSHRQNRTDQYTLVVQSSQDYANINIDSDHKYVLDNLISQTSDLIGHNAGLANYKSIHIWRYASTRNYNKNSEQLPVFCDQDLNLALCGDWSLRGRGSIENAFTSAYNISKIIRDYI